MGLFFSILLILFLILLNGFFVASEFALVAVRKTRIKELSKKGNIFAKMVHDSLDNLGTYISATQLGVTISSLGLGWVGEPTIAGFLLPYFHMLPKEAALITSHTAAVISSFIIITFFHIILGELIPKTIALQKAERLSLLIITPLVGFAIICKPFIWIIKAVSNVILSLFHLSSTSSAYESVHSEEEVKMILAQSAETGAIPQKEVEMMNNVFRLGEIPVKHIMLPRTDIVAFSRDESIEQMLPVIETSLHSRFPVYEGSIDTIIGFIHIKDIYQLLLKTNGEQKKLTDTSMVREIIYVPETKKADRVLLEMRKKRIHIAVVNDEYGGTAGIVTLEDVIESLVGEIQDEFEEPENEMKRMTDGSYLVDGLTSLEKLQTKFDLPLKGQGFTTIGGLIFGLLGREPKKDDRIQLGDVTFIIEEMYKKRIRFLRVKKEKKKS